MIMMMKMKMMRCLSIGTLAEGTLSCFHVFFHMDAFKTLQTFDLGAGKEGRFHSLPALERAGIGPISRLPVSIRIVLESVLRNLDGKKVNKKDVETLANWRAKSPAQVEIPFVVARIVLQDFTGVPLLVDLAAMRSAGSRPRRAPAI